MISHNNIYRYILTLTDIFPKMPAFSLNGILILKSSWLTLFGLMIAFLILNFSELNILILRSSSLKPRSHSSNMPLILNNTFYFNRDDAVWIRHRLEGAVDKRLVQIKHYALLSYIFLGNWAKQIVCSPLALVWAALSTIYVILIVTIIIILITKS